MNCPFKNGDRLLFQGDSITDCDCRSTDNLNPLGTGYVSIVRGLIAERWPDLKITVLNRGRSGDRSCELVDRWESDSLTLRPSWISIMVGVNDVWRLLWERDGGPRHIPIDEFSVNVKKLIDHSRTGGVKEIVLVSPTTIDDDLDSKLNRMLLDYAAATKEIASEFGTRYVDVQTPLRNAVARIPTVRWTSDGCHPTIAGHAVIANAWLNGVCLNS